MPSPRFSVTYPTVNCTRLLRTHLTEEGASFFADLYGAAGGGDPVAVADSLWDLVWAGEVTNDSLAPVWERLRPTRRRTGRNLSSRFTPDVQGRWSLLPGRGNPTTTDRKAGLGEAAPGTSRPRHPGNGGGRRGRGWLHLALPRLRPDGGAGPGETGLLRGWPRWRPVRGSPGAVDRLRATSDPVTLLLAATDPANPYGATLPWPTSPARLARVPGAHVVLEGGELRAYLDHGKLTSLGTLPDGLPDLLAGMAQRVRRFEIREVDGLPTTSTPAGSALVAAGWRPTPKGLRP